MNAAFPPLPPRPQDPAQGRHRDLGQPLLLPPGRRRLSARGRPHPLAGLDQGVVVELLIVVALVLAVVVVAVTPWTSLLAVGALTTVAGLAFGVATGFWYHVALARALSAVKALTPRWWLRPVPLHARLATV